MGRQWRQTQPPKAIAAFSTRKEPWDANGSGQWSESLRVSERGPGGPVLRAACVIPAFLSNLWTGHVISISSGFACPKRGVVSLSQTNAYTTGHGWLHLFVVFAVARIEDPYLE